MTDAVRQLMLAYLRGEATAEQVVAAVKPRPTEPPPKSKSTDQVLLETTQDYVTARVWDETWADVERMWGLLTPARQEELTRARQRAGR